MSILGVIVRARPEQADGVQAALAATPGLEIAAAQGARWVVVIESPTAHATLLRITQLPQVLSSALVYEYSGPDSPAADAHDASFRSWRGNPALEQGQPCKPTDATS